MKFRFIFNPHSGNNRTHPHRFDYAREFIREHDLNATVTSTERPLHATELARRAVDEGCDVVVAIGGDGTMNEVATALVDTPASLGLIPCGSGNGLGRNLGVFGHRRHPWQCLLNGRTRTIDAGEIDGRLFFTVAGLGFEAVIADQFARMTKRGFFRYLTTSAAAFRHHQAEACLVRVDGQELAVNPFTLAITNCDQYGNNAYIAPGAKVDDGLLDLTAVPALGLLGSLPMLAQLFTGRLDRNPSVQRARSAAFTIERAGPGLIHTDGEPWAAGKILEVKVRPACLRVIVPAR